MPREYYFTQNDHINLSVWNSKTGVSVAVQGLIENDNGEFLPFAFTLTPSADRAVSTTQRLIGQGWLHNLIVRPSAGSPVRGQTYCRLSKRYGSLGAGLDTSVLAQGYVADGQFLSYPGARLAGSTEGEGNKHTFTVADVTAGSEISQTVPTGALWQLFSVRASLVTDATVADRWPLLALGDGTNDIGKFTTLSPIPASQTQHSLWSSMTDNDPTTYTERLGKIPPVIYLPAGFTIVTDTLNFQAGDQWIDISLQVEEWLQP